MDALVWLREVAPVWSLLHQELDNPSIASCWAVDTFVVGVEGRDHLLLQLGHLLSQWDKGDPDCILAWPFDHQDCPVLVAIEEETGTGWPSVSHQPQHGHPGQLVEAISGIYERRSPQPIP
eukprot:9567482-Ditylum_brightwellii.AAC.1